MSHLGKGYDINQTFVIEPFDNAIPEFSACTSVYTNFIQSCSGDTSIFLGTGIVSVDGNLSATIISATTYYGDGSHLTGLITQDTYITGGTYSNGTATFTNNTGGTFNVIGFYTGATDVFVTGGTYSSGIVTFVNNTGGTFTVSGFTTSFNGGIVSGFTTFTSGLSASTISATTYYGDGSHLTGLVAQDTYVTGGTYSNGTASFTNNTGGTFSVSGFTTPFTGGTVSGATNFIGGLTANTISATTYENLPFVSNVVTVAKSGGDFTNIADAVDSIVDSSSNNRYVVRVAPGRYVEREILMQGKEFISVVGDDILQVLVVASASTQNIFTLGNNNELSFMTISGATSGVALMCENLDGFSLVHKISIYDCDTNVFVHSTSADSNFYGEYMDFNGSYSYGTRILAENGFIAYANIENYYNFPTGPNPTIANSVQGSGATLSVFVGDGIGNGVSGSTNYEISDYASLNTTTTTAEGWDYCLRNVNVGGPCRFDIDSLSVNNSMTYDISVEHSGTFGTFNGSSTHTKINTISENIYWSFLDSEDGELEITRKMSVTFQDGTHTDASTLIFEGSTMGLINGGVITVVSGLTINVSSGFGYLEKTVGAEIYLRVDFPSTNLVLSPNTNNYIFFNDNEILSVSNTAPDSTQNIILGRVVTHSSSIAFIDASPYNASHTSNGLSMFNRDALGPIYSTGSLVTQNATPFHLNISSGVYHFSENMFSPTGGTNVTFSQYVRNGSGGWNVTQTSSVAVGYDNNTGSVVSLPSSAFTKHTLYVVGQGINEKYFLVLGQANYASLVLAEAADLPTPPTYFDDSVAPIASIFVQQGYSGITQIQDIRPVIGFKAAGVSATAVHANLLGLSADDHTQYLLANGGRAMSGNLDMGSNNVISAGTFNGVTVESHASRHKNGGADEIATSTPAPSEIPKADTFGKLDSWISDASDSVKGLTQLSVAPVSTPIAVGVNDNRFLKSFTGGSYNNSTSTLSLTSVDGTPYTISGFSNNFTGGTVSGATNFINGLTASTISATSIYSPFTTGSVIFQGSGGTLTQNNSQLFWDNTNNRLGVGTNTFWGTTQALVVGSATEGRLGVANTGKQGVYLGRVSNFSQIFAYDYTASAALPLAINSFGGNVLIGTTTDAGFKLDVNGTTRLSGTTTITGDLQVTNFGYGNGQGNTKSFNTQGVSSGTKITFYDINAYTSASGNVTQAYITNSGFNPTGGTATYVSLNLGPTINQTGGANGITRGLYVAPTLTAAADFRAIETTVGKVVLNSISGNTLIGTTTDSGYKLDVNGTTRLSGNTIVNGGLTATTVSATSIYSPFTTGSIIFQGSGGTLSQSNSQLFWDNTNNRLGINTNIPGYTLDAQHIGTTSVTGRLVFRNENNSYSTLALFSNGLGLTLQSHSGGNGYISSNNALNFTAYDSTNPTTIWVGNGARFRVGNSAGSAEYLRISPSGNTLINTSIDSGYNLDVSGTTRLNGLSSVNGVSVANTALAVYGNGNGAGNYIIQGYDASAVQRFYLTASGNFRLNGATDTGTTGTDEKWRMILNFAPTSGTRQHNGIYLTQTINQTGGANGITRGLLVEPTLTAAADYRAIETTVGKVVLNSISGNTLIGTTTDSGYKLDVIGNTRISGNTIVNNGLTATTVSATTYQNLPVSAITAGTNIGVSNTDGNYTISFTGTTGGSFTGGTVSGPTTFTAGLTATTISATTYQNLPVTADTFTTGFTYSNNVFTLSRNQGLSSLTALINTMSGLTINGALTVTGATALNGAITSTALTGTTDRMMEVSSGGTVSASRQIISAYLTSGGTVANLLENTANWDIDGNYTGTTITGTYQGQKHYNGNYLFEAVADNLFIRLIRG